MSQNIKKEKEFIDAYLEAFSLCMAHYYDAFLSNKDDLLKIEHILRPKSAYPYELVDATKIMREYFEKEFDEEQQKKILKSIQTKLKQKYAAIAKVRETMERIYKSQAKLHYPSGNELRIHLAVGNKLYAEKIFENFPSRKSAHIVICHTNNENSKKQAIELYEKLTRSIKGIEKDFRDLTLMEEITSDFSTPSAPKFKKGHKLLIAVTDGQSDEFTDDALKSWQEMILPVYQHKKWVLLPSPFADFQGEFWNKHIGEVVPAILGLVGISEESQRIFISYRKIDATPLAKQLFDALTREGFEVFLDEFSINPGVHFQNRLSQQLSDKAMVIFLESKNFFDSKWVEHEVNFAKRHRLGLMALRVFFKGDTKEQRDKQRFIKSIDSESRKDITISGPKGKVTKAGLEEILTMIKMQHSIALYRQRHYLNVCIRKALRGKATIITDENGFMEVTSKSTQKRYKIWTTPRPPEVKDYHYTDTSNPKNDRMIFGKGSVELNREVLNLWLAEKSTVTFFNEGQLSKLVETITK